MNSKGSGSQTRIRGKRNVPSASVAHAFLEQAAKLLNPVESTNIEPMPEYNNLNDILEAIKSNLFQIQQTNKNVLTNYVELGNTLNLLKSNWPNTTKEYYSFCLTTFKLHKSTICAILDFGDFIRTYPKFKSTGIKYTKFKNVLSNLKQWFSTADANILQIDNVLSPKFWK
jgi:hypothetical protein